MDTKLLTEALNACRIVEKHGIDPKRLKGNPELGLAPLLHLTIAGRGDSEEIDECLKVLRDQGFHLSPHFVDIGYPTVEVRIGLDEYFGLKEIRELVDPNYSPNLQFPRIHRLSPRLP